MTIKEFVKNNPSEALTASKSKDLNEFKELAAQVGIKFSDDASAKGAFNEIKELCANNELSEDALASVAGGKSKKKKVDTQKMDILDLNDKNVFRNENGDYIYKM